MTRFGLTAVVLAAGVLLWSSSAKADTITINAAQTIGGGIPLSHVTLVSATSPVSFSGPCCGAGPQFADLHMDADGTPFEPSGQLSSNAIAVRTTHITPEALWIWVTETGVTSPLGADHFTSGLTANLLSGHISSVTLWTYLNPDNMVSPIGFPPTNGEHLLDTATFTAIGHSSNTVDMNAGSGPYALVEVYEVVTSGGPADANLTIDLVASPTAVIPEPATLALLGTALVGIAGLRRRR